MTDPEKRARRAGFLLGLRFAGRVADRIGAHHQCEHKYGDVITLESIYVNGAGKGAVDVSNEIYAVIRRMNDEKD